MADIRSLYPVDKRELQAKRRERRRELMGQLASESGTPRAGFSARLNMLCSLSGERELTDGRIEDIAALKTTWEPGDVRAWLTEDSPPPLEELELLVRFLTHGLSSRTPADHWTAYLLFGSDYIENPLRALTDVSEDALHDLATATLLQLTKEYKIPPHAYDADVTLAALTAALRDLNVSSSEEVLQPGHRRLLARRVFPEYC